MKENIFRNRILEEFRYTGRTLLSFQELWKICHPMRNNFPEPLDTTKKFIRELLKTIHFLENDGIVRVHTKDMGNKVSHITITSEGMMQIK